MLTVADALATTAEQNLLTDRFFPEVEERPLHSIDPSQTFFDSLRSDYPGFDEWFRRSSREGRKGFVIDGPDGQVAGLCVLKRVDHEIGTGRRPSKVSTFKVGEEFKGNPAR